MKLNGKKIALIALLTLALTLLCSGAFAAIQGSGTQADPYLLSSFISGQDLPEGDNYYKNDLSIDLYVYSDNNGSTNSYADLYFCSSNNAPYTETELMDYDFTNYDGKLSVGETSGANWETFNSNTHGDHPKIGFYGISMMTGMMDRNMPGSPNNPYKLSQFTGTQTLPSTPYATITLAGSKAYAYYCYLNDLGRDVYLFNSSDGIDLYISLTNSCDDPTLTYLRKFSKNNTTPWCTFIHTNGQTGTITVPAIPAVPSTGDSTNLTLLALLAAAALVGMAILSCKKRCLSK